MTSSPHVIDISKSKFDARLIREGGRLRHRVFPNSPDGFPQLRARLTRHEVVHAHACLEATGANGEAPATYLHDAGHAVGVVNPASAMGSIRGGAVACFGPMWTRHCPKPGRRRGRASS